MVPLCRFVIFSSSFVLRIFTLDGFKRRCVARALVALLVVVVVVFFFVVRPSFAPSVSSSSSPFRHHHHHLILILILIFILFHHTYIASLSVGPRSSCIRRLQSPSQSNRDIQSDRSTLACAAFARFSCLYSTNLAHRQLHLLLPTHHQLLLELVLTRFVTRHCFFCLIFSCHPCASLIDRVLLQLCFSSCDLSPTCSSSDPHNFFVVVIRISSASTAWQPLPLGRTLSPRSSPRPPTAQPCPA